MKPSRILLISIIATGVLYIAGFVALGSSYPNIDSSGQEIIKWFSDNGTSARIYAWTAAFFSLGLAIFGGQVSALPQAASVYFFDRSTRICHYGTSPGLVLGGVGISSTRS